MPSHQHSQPSPQAPSVGDLPVVLDEADVVQRRIDADGVERLQIEVLQVRRVRLQDHLELVVVLQAVGVLAVAAVLRPARGLHIGGVPRLRPERAQRGRRMEGAGADLHVVGLQDHAAVVGPVALQRQDQPLERPLRAHMGGKIGHFSWISWKISMGEPSRTAPPVKATGKSGFLHPAARSRRANGQSRSMAKNFF